jgi:phage shock protein A
MPLMMSKLYHALLEAGVDEQHATEAAEEAAQYENRFAGIESRLARIETQLDSLNHRLTLMMTVIFIVLGGVLSTLWVLARR